MHDIGPGTPLIFIGPESDIWPSGLTIDALYFVKEVIPRAGIRALMGCLDTVSLRGNPGYHESYCLCSFKPLGEGEPPPEEEEEIEPPKEFHIGPLPKVPVTAVTVVYRARKSDG